MSVRALVIPVLFAGTALAGEYTAGASQLSSPISVRQAGMGEVGVAGPGALGAWNNPALLAGQESTWEVSAGGAQVLGDATAVTLGAGWGIGESLTVGAFVLSTGSDVAEVDAAGELTGESLGQDVLIGGAGLSWKAGRLVLGASGKYVGEATAGVSAATVAGDAGISFNVFPALALLASVRNLGGTLDYGGGIAPALPMEIRAGGNYAVGPLALCAEYVFVPEADSSVGAGIEYWPSRAVGLRAGAVFDTEGNGPIRITAGLTGSIMGICLEYALSTHEVGLSNRAGISYGFGSRGEQQVVEKGAPVVSVKPGSARKLPGLAVADMETKGVSKPDAEAVSGLLRSELAKSGSFDVAGKPEMDKALAGSPQSGCASEDCAVEMGKLLGVRKVVVGAIAREAGLYSVRLRVVNAGSGKVEYSDSARGQGLDEIKEGIKTLAQQIAEKVR